MNLAEFRDATYDIDKDFNRTTSWSDSLNENSRFVPHLPRPVRRSSSTDDVQRYTLYFSLAQRNQGKLFTWRHYLKILRDELRNFDTILIMTKMLLMKGLATPTNSEVSNYITASDSEPSNKKMSVKNRLRKISFKRRKVAADAESISSMDDMSINSSISLTPQTNLLKKMCTEIRTLARKTCKTVEKISTKSKFCSACGDYIGNVKVHKDCSQPFLGMNKCNKPLTPNIIKTTTIVKTKSTIYDTAMDTPKGGGEHMVNQFRKMTFAPNNSGRMKPFIKRSPVTEN